MLDLAKFDQQAATVVALTTHLLATDGLPVFVPDAPSATYADAVAMLQLTTVRPRLHRERGPYGAYRMAPEPPRR